MFGTGALRYWLLTIAGLLLAGGSIVAIDWGLYQLVRTGTCASGGPYVIARPCPDDVTLHFFVLFGGFFTALIGIGLWAARGSRGRPSPVGLGTAMWALLFCTLAGAAALAAFGPAANEDNDGAELAAIILAVVLVPMGLAPVPFAAMANRSIRPSGRRVADLVARGEMTPPPIARPPSPPPAFPSGPPATWAGFSPASTGDPAKRVERLDELLRKGLISVAEYENQKKRILGGT